MTTFCDLSKPKYVVYVQWNKIPRYYHKELSGAVEEATRLAKIADKKAYIIEYFEMPTVIGFVNPDGTMGEM